MRLDLNVPLDENREITDDTRIRAALPTIQKLLEGGSRLIIGSHLGRPKGVYDPKYSLLPVAEHLSKLLNEDVVLAQDFTDEGAAQFSQYKKDWKVMLLENLRFHPGEAANDPDFSHQLASLAEVYVTDAFGTCHRKHASTYGVPSLMPFKAMGGLIKAELEVCNRLLKERVHPYVLLMGGAKVDDKIETLESLLHIADTLIIGGKMALAFLKAKGISVGANEVAEHDERLAQKIIRQFEREKRTLLLPIDHTIATSPDSPSQVSQGAEVPEGFYAYDIGPKTTELFKTALKNAKVIFWNGPMGFFEKSPFHEGTFAMAHALAESKAFTVIGGGDSASAAAKAGVTEQISHISTGGGATLEYLAKGSLPGITILNS